MTTTACWPACRLTEKIAEVSCAGGNQRTFLKWEEVLTCGQ